MLPLQQAREVRDSVIEYIKATFRFKEKDVSDAFYRLIESRENGLPQKKKSGMCHSTLHPTFLHINTSCMPFSN